MSEETATRHATIEGRVQGVGYRAWTAANARKLGLRGWVRNRGDGTVEAIFHGPKNAVESMIELCWKGPLVARVRKVSVEQAATPENTGFDTLPTL